MPPHFQVSVKWNLILLKLARIHVKGCFFTYPASVCTGTVFSRVLQTRKQKGCIPAPVGYDVFSYMFLLCCKRLVRLATKTNPANPDEQPDQSQVSVKWNLILLKLARMRGKAFFSRFCACAGRAFFTFLRMREGIFFSRSSYARGENGSCPALSILISDGANMSFFPRNPFPPY